MIPQLRENLHQHTQLRVTSGVTSASPE
jgi:hypothetical protein